MSDEIDDVGQGMRRMMHKIRSMLVQLDPTATIEEELRPCLGPCLTTTTQSDGVAFQVIPTRRGHPGWFYPWGHSEVEATIERTASLV